MSTVLGGPKHRIFYKIVGIKVSRTSFLTICVIIFRHTGCIFIRYYAFYIYIVVTMKEFNENKVLNNVNVEL